MVCIDPCYRAALERGTVMTAEWILLALQTDAIQATTNLLEWEVPKEQWPEIAFIQKCHSGLKVHPDTLLLYLHQTSGTS